MGRRGFSFALDLMKSDLPDNPFYFPFMLDYLFFCIEFKQVTLNLVGQLIWDLETAFIQNLLRKSRGFKLILRNRLYALKKDYLKLHFSYIIDFETLKQRSEF